MNCPNCDTPATGRFCARCGQDNRRTRPTFLELLADWLGRLVDMDARAWRTVRELCVDPGGVVRRYNEGKRVRYVQPLRYAVATAALWWLAVYWQFVNAGLPTQGVVSSGQFLNLAMLPALALPIWLAFAGAGYGYLQHLNLVLFFGGQLFLWRALLALLGMVWPGGWIRLDNVDFVFFCALLSWLLFGCFRGRARWLWARIPAAVVLFIAVSTGLLTAIFWLLA